MIRFFQSIQSILKSLKKSFRQIVSSFSLRNYYIRLFYVKSLAMCSEVRKFIKTDERSGVVGGGGIEKKYSLNLEFG